MNDNFGPLISIIVPVYNSEKYLCRCIQSIQKQNYSNIEIIMVDDGSTDESGKICDELAAKDARIKVIHKKNGGQASARNQGISIARGDLIGFVDNDDVIEPNMFEVLYNNKIKNNVRISAIIADWVYGDKVLCHSEQFETRLYTGKELLLNMLYKENLISSSVWDKLFDRDLFNDVEFPEGCEYEDYWVLSQILPKVNEIYIETIPLYHWFQYETSQSKGGFHEKSRTYIEIPKRIVKSYNDNNFDSSLVNAAKNFLLLGYIKFFGKIFTSRVLLKETLLVKKYQRELKELVVVNDDQRVKKNVMIKCRVLSSPLIYLYSAVWEIHYKRQQNRIHYA